MKTDEITDLGGQEARRWCAMKEQELQTGPGGHGGLQGPTGGHRGATAAHPDVHRGADQGKGHPYRLHQVRGRATMCSIPVGSASYVKAKVADNKSALIGVGTGITMEKPIEEAMIHRREAPPGDARRRQEVAREPTDHRDEGLPIEQGARGRVPAHGRRTRPVRSLQMFDSLKRIFGRQPKEAEAPINLEEAVGDSGKKIAKARKRDVVLVDTAGRMQTNANLMDEMKKIKRVVKPHLTSSSATPSPATMPSSRPGLRQGGRHRRGHPDQDRRRRQGRRGAVHRLHHQEAHRVPLHWPGVRGDHQVRRKWMVDRLFS